MTTTNASGLFAAVMLGLFLGGCLVASGIINHLAWTFGGGF